MAFLSAPMLRAGFSCPCHSVLPSKSSGHNHVRFSGRNFVRTLPRNKVLGERRLSTRHFSRKHIVTAQGGNYNMNYEDGVPSRPSRKTLVQEFQEAMDSLFAFLAEQPSQLKCIEWPSFQSTLKTACLTLIIGALFIIALWSVDSVMCYLLTLATKRSH